MDRTTLARVARSSIEFSRRRCTSASNAEINFDDTSKFIAVPRMVVVTVSVPFQERQVPMRGDAYRLKRPVQKLLTSILFEKYNQALFIKIDVGYAH